MEILYLQCDKNPGVRPIVIGEVLRRIVGKVIIATISPDIVKSAGSIQLCAGQQAGCEAAVHAMNQIFQEEETDALLLVDATNAFNSINRQAMLHNIQYICPPMATYAYNSYCVSSRLFIQGGKELSSSEGTTQRDSFAMAMYAIGITPLFNVIRNEDTRNLKQAAFADDLGGAGPIHELKSWWKNIERYMDLYLDIIRNHQNRGLLLNQKMLVLQRKSSLILICKFPLKVINI